jgi:peptidoglycan hydrolase CwlO-like protein
MKKSFLGVIALTSIIILLSGRGERLGCHYSSEEEARVDELEEYVAHIQEKKDTQIEDLQSEIEKLKSELSDLQFELSDLQDELSDLHDEFSNICCQ